MTSPLLPQPIDRISYPVPHGGEGSLHIYHNGSIDVGDGTDDDDLSDRVILMCPGFPDDHRGLSPLAGRLASTASCRILVGVMCLPGYEYPPDLQQHPNDGYTFDDWVATIREASKVLRSYYHTSFRLSNSTRRVVVTGIFHDWSVVAGLLWHNREDPANRVDQLVLLDVLPMLHPQQQQSRSSCSDSSSFSYNEFCILAYQFCFAINFWLYQHVPPLVIFCFQYLTEWTLTAAKCFPVSVDDYRYLHTMGILPVTVDNCKRLGYMSYPYRNIRRLRKSIFNLTTLPYDDDDCALPILFLYGGAKWVPLHDPTSLIWLQNSKAGRVVHVETAGHWLHQTHLEVCGKEIRDFVLCSTSDTTQKNNSIHEPAE